MLTCRLDPYWLYHETFCVSCLPFLFFTFGHALRHDHVTLVVFDVALLTFSLSLGNVVEEIPICSGGRVGKRSIPSYY